MNPPLSRRLYRPRPVAVECGQFHPQEGQNCPRTPIRVGGGAVEEVLEEWLVEDRWWTERPLRRRYYELLLETGAIKVVFFDLENGGWMEQPGG